jgi:type I restriction enzyme M protein
VEKEGRVAVVMPHGVLFRGGAEGRIRQKLIEDNLLDAVIGLPGNLFPTTSIPVAILIFDRSRGKGGLNEARKEVLFIDASNEYQPGKNQNTLRDEHLHRIIQVYNEFRNSLTTDQWSMTHEKFAHAASFEEIKENDFNLNIPRYVDTFEEEEDIDIQAVQQEIAQLETELAEVRSKMDRLLKEVVA